MIYRFGSIEYDFSHRTHIMGILNVTPDSFADGGRWNTAEAAVAHGLRLIQEGADFLDVGGESTRPGSEPVSVEEELRRVIPVIVGLREQSTVPISIDTYKAEVAQRALEAGAVIVNDITGLHRDPKIAKIVSGAHASVVLMHMQGMPRTMQENPSYENVIDDLCSYFDESISIALNDGVSQIILDPGLGFGKMLHHNLDIIHNLREFQRFGYPVLVGPSRKSFIGKLLDLPVEERIEGTCAAVAASIFYGAQIVRVHDVKEIKRVATVVDALVHPNWQPVIN
jgi:dihydropteroate synthase